MARLIAVIPTVLLSLSLLLPLALVLRSAPLPDEPSSAAALREPQDHGRLGTELEPLDLAEEENSTGLAMPDRAPDHRPLLHSLICLFRDCRHQKSGVSTAAGEEAAMEFLPAAEDSVAEVGGDRIAGEVIGWVPKEEADAARREQARRKAKRSDESDSDSGSDSSSDSDSDSEEERERKRKRRAKRSDESDSDSDSDSDSERERKRKRKRVRKGKGGFLRRFWCWVKRF